MNKETIKSLNDKMLIDAYHNFINLIERHASAPQRIELIFLVNRIAEEITERKLWNETKS